MHWIVIHVVSLFSFVRLHWAASITTVIAFCSTLHTLLPPWDWKPAFVEEGLVDFPGLQNAFYAIFHSRYYKLLVYVVGYVALNARSTLWRSISINNPDGTNVKKIKNGTGTTPGPSAP